MGTVTLSNGNQRLADFDAGTGYTTTNIGGGAAPGQELVTFYEGTASVSRKVVSSTAGGWWVNLTTPADMTSNDNRVFMGKVFLSDGADLNSNGLRFYIGDTTGDYYQFQIHDDGTNVEPYPGTRSWLIVPIDPNLTEFRFATSGTPNLTIVDEFAIVAGLATGGAKSENLFLDEIDLSNGLYLVDGVGDAFADGTFEDFVSYDEGTQSNRFGHVITQEGILYVVGKLVIGRTATTAGSPSAGTPTITHFDDVGSILVFPESRTASGWNEIEVDLSAGTAGSPDEHTRVYFTSNIFNGRGTGPAKAFFGTTADVDGGAETIVLDDYIGELRTGDAVVYSQEGGTQNIGLTNNTTYWVFSAGTNTWSIHPTYADGLAGTNPVNLTAGGTETHSFQKTPDTRPYFTVVGNTGEFIADGVTFDTFGILTLTSGATLTGCTIANSEEMIQDGATITGCVILGSTTEDGEAFLLADDLSKISNNDFVFSDGHAIEITADALGVGSPTSFDFDGNTFTGFGAIGTTDAAIYNNSGSTIVINILSGDTPTYRNGPGSVTIINNAVTLQVQGLSEGAAVKIVANETVGTITSGDVLLEALADANGQASTSINYESAFDPSGLDVITRCRQQGLPTAAIQDDNGSYTDETTAANSAVTADMNLLPAVPVVNQDGYIFGHAESFTKLKLVINTPGLGGFTITWQYWNGTGWSSLSNVVDDTNSYANSGKNYVSWDMPGDWAKTTINGQGPYYYVRAFYTAGTVTQVPTGTKCTLDVTRYLPFVQSGTVTSSGLTVTASWVEDTIATF